MKEVMVAAVGDFMLERRLKAGDIESVRGMFGDADLVIANLDTVISDKGEAVPKWANLRGPRELARDFRELGIDVAVLANNHAMDFGADGMLDMIDALADAGVATVGAGRNLAEASAPLMIERSGRTIAIVAAASTLSPGAAAEADRAGVAPLRAHFSFELDESLFAEQPGSVPDVKTWVDQDDLERVQNDVRQAREQADDVLVVMHWGVPTPWRPSAHPIVQEHQSVTGRALIDAGATGVIGNHPHELHGIELYRGRPIAYCLGNFWIDTISDYPWMGREAIALRLALKSDSAPETFVLPIKLGEDGVPSIERAGAVTGMLNRLSRDYGVEALERGTGDGSSVRLAGA